MAGLLYRLGRLSARRRWTVIIGWLVVFALTGVAFGLFHGTISSSFSVPGTPTAKVVDELAKKFPTASGGSGTLVFTTKDGDAFTESEKAAIARLLSQLDDLPGVRSTTDPFTAQSKLDDQRAQVSDGQKQLADGERQLASAQDQLDAERQQLEQAQQQLDEQRAQAQAAGQTAALQPQLDAAQSRIDSGKQQLDAAQAQLDEQRTTLQQTASKLDLTSRLLELSRNARVVSADGSAAIGTVQFAKPVLEVPQTLKDTLISKAEKAHIAGVDVYVSNDIAQGSGDPLGSTEFLGLIVAAIVLLLVLRTIAGAALPLASAVLGVGVATLGALSFSSLVEFIAITPVLGIMLGLAVGIDYSLFILSRHRRQLSSGVDVHESIGLADGTAGNAVVFAGSTVIVALLALNVTGIPFLGLMGTVGAVAVAVAICVAVTFTPAMLSLVGIRILRPKERARIGRPESAREPRAPMSGRRAVVTLVAGVAALAIVALPALQMRLGLPDGSSEATDSTQYKAYRVVERAFGAGQNGPLLVVADLPTATTGDDLLRQEATIGTAIEHEGDVAAVVPIGASSDDTVVAFQVIPKSGPSSAQTESLVHRLRALSPLTTDAGAVVLGVAGNASATIDVSQKLTDALPLYLVVVVGLSLLILILVFRSILVPVTATAGFVLSLLAAFGGLTAIYQLGWLGPVFGVHDPGPTLSFLPIIEVGVLFGLAMDYQLFLVSGMREAYTHGARAAVAVRRGLDAGRVVVTAAAIIMISVFAGFIFSDSASIKPIGFGLAFGVLVDAFVVRLLLIPAAMHLLGRAAWWLPRWLDRLLPDVDVEGARLERPHPHPGEHATDPADATGDAHASREA